MTASTSERADRTVDVRTPAGTTAGSVTLPGELFDDPKGELTVVKRTDMTDPIGPESDAAVTSSVDVRGRPPASSYATRTRTWPSPAATL